METAERYATTRQLAELLHREPQTLRLWRSRGQGPPWIELGGRVLYEVADVERWLGERKRGPAEGGTEVCAR